MLQGNIMIPILQNPPQTIDFKNSPKVHRHYAPKPEFELRHLDDKADT